MTEGGEPYDREGKVIQAAAFQKGEGEPRLREFSLIDGGLVCCEVRARSADGATDSRWVGNAGAVTQIAPDRFRTSLSTKQHDAYSVLLRHNKLPWPYSTTHQL
jgi:nuclear GTP-binding protein